LIEMMITVAVVAILARIALPSYLNYVKRGKLTEAFNQMSACSQSLGQYYQDNRTYVGGTCTASASPSNFTYAMTSATATSYTLTATGSTSAVSGFTYTLTDAGTRGTTSVPSGWAANAGNCWVNSASGACQ